MRVSIGFFKPGFVKGQYLILFFFPNYVFFPIQNNPTAFEVRPFQERHAIPHACAHTCTKAFRIVRKSERANQIFDYTFLLHNCLCLPDIYVHFHVTIKQTVVLDY